VCELVVKLSNNKEIKVDKETLTIINKYIRFEYTLEALARDLGLDSWEEAYEFIKKLPAWLAWTMPSLFEYEKERICREAQS